MHSIAIHFGKKYEDWHLVEPFYYKLQKNKQLTFYWEEEVYTSAPLAFPSVDRILEHLDRHRVKDWQLILLLNLHDVRNRQLRLTTHLAEIRKRLLEPFRDKGAFPLQTTLILVDMLKRDSNFAPKDEVQRRYWELDQFGYLQTGPENQRSGNSFTNAEINNFDVLWGGKINLHEVVLDQPDGDFMKDLGSRSNRVEEYLYQLINRKKEYYLNSREGKDYDDWLSPLQLDSILKDFESKLTQIKRPPLATSLSVFSPSRELSNILKYQVGIQNEIGDIRLIRKEIIHSSHRERIKGYLELTYFLLTISHHPKLIERMGKGSTNFIEVTLDEERVEKLLVQYNLSLQTAKGELEDQILLHSKFQMHPLVEDEFTPYIAAGLEKKSRGESPKQKITAQFFEEWQNQLFDDETFLKNREKELQQSSKEAIIKLDVLKRKNEFPEEDVLVEITEYKQKLLGQIGRAQLKVIDSAPSLSEALVIWREQISETKKRMHFLLQKMPNKRQLIACSLLIFFILMYPFFQTLMANDALPMGNYWYLLFLPVGFTLVFTYFGYYITRMHSHHPVQNLKEETDRFTEKMYQLQADSQHQYNQYLNSLFRLFSLRKYHEKVTAAGEETKANNMLQRYHLIKLEEFVHMSNRLLHVLQINKEQSPDIKEARVPAIHYGKSVMDNPVYSPFQSLGAVKQTGIEVFLGSAKDHYQSTYINELDKIRIQEDKVYK